MKTNRDIEHVRHCSHKTEAANCLLNVFVFGHI